MTLDDRLARLEQVAARLEERMKGFASDHHELVTAIQGPPREESLRGRIHKLESDNAAARAATAAVEAVKLVQKQASDRRFTRGEKFVGLTIAALSLTTSMVSVLTLLSNHH